MIALVRYLVNFKLSRFSLSSADIHDKVTVCSVQEPLATAELGMVKDPFLSFKNHYLLENNLIKMLH